MAKPTGKPSSRKLTLRRPHGLLAGEFSNPVRVVAFNTVERWSEDVSEDVPQELRRRYDLAGLELPASIQAFVESRVGSDRQLTLRLA
jgi:hypothetical protein